MTKLTFIIGGARSGKSSYAERLAAQANGRVLYVATAQALDEEMRTRIAAHQRKRPAAWQTRELSADVGRRLTGRAAAGGCDPDRLPDVTGLEPGAESIARMWTSPMSWPQRRWCKPRSEELLKAIRSIQARWLVVSNEVGQGAGAAVSGGAALS